MLSQVTKEFWITLHKDPRRARSASQSIVPTSTWRFKNVYLVTPSQRKIRRYSYEGSYTERFSDRNSLLYKKDLTVEKINLAFKRSTKKQKKKILEISDEKLVSIDFNHNSASCIVDASLTSVIGKNMGKISAWYDNEWGFSNRMCDIVEFIHKNS